MHDQARAACSSVRSHPRQREAHALLVLGHALKTLGSLREAAEAYRAAALACPSLGEAYSSLASLGGYRFSHEEITRMWTQEASAGVAQSQRYHLCVALGRALADRGEHELSRHYYERASRARRNAHPAPAAAPGA